MANPFLGEIRPVPYNFAPFGWAFCNGQILSISQNTVLFSLLGTNFGGNGQSTFGLPNLPGSVPICPGQGPGLSPYNIGETVGSATVTLTQGQMASHNHPAIADGGRVAASLNTPVGNAWGKSGADTPYSSGTPNVHMSPNSTTPAGGGGAHNNLMSYLTINYIIALQGIYPARG